MNTPLTKTPKRGTLTWTNCGYPRYGWFHVTDNRVMMRMSKRHVPLCCCLLEDVVEFTSNPTGEVW